MKILVTGGAGFIGSNLVDDLIGQGHEVGVLDNLSTGQRDHIHPLAQFYFKNLNEEELSDIFEEFQPEVVYHLAAQIDVQHSINDPYQDAKNNILGTIRLLECCQKYCVRKIIYASSAAIYGEPVYLGIDEQHPVAPISNYGISKLTPEYYIRSLAQLTGISYTILRFANVYGPRQAVKGEGGVVAVFTKSARNNETVNVFGNGEQTRDFIYVKDIVSALTQCLIYGDNETLNIGTSQPTSVNELISIIEKVIDMEVRVNYKNAREGDILHSYFTNEKAKIILKWEPKYSLQQGVMEMFEIVPN